MTSGLLGETPTRLAMAAWQSRASQDPFELWQLLEAIARLAPAKILEIGVHRGYSAETWRHAFPNAEVVGVESDVDHLDFTQFRLVHGNSRTAAVCDKVRGYGPYDFLFIDGDHTYEGAKSDWEKYRPMVRSGGIVALHDTRRIGERWTGLVETRKLFDELRQHHPSLDVWNGDSSDTPGVGILYV